jgi:parvulin-like peptidyl-prolyl isomerase
MAKELSSVARASRALVGVIVSAGIAAGCGGAAGTPPVAPPASPDVWAVVDGREILRDEVDRLYRTSLLEGATPSDEEALSAKLNIVEDLITQDLLLARARAANLQVSDTELDAAFAERRQGMTEAEFQKRLTERNLTTEDIRTGMRRELSAQKILEQDVIAKVTVSDGDIAAFYERHKDQFNVTETQYRLAQIVVTPARDPQLGNRMNDDAATADEARRKVDMLLGKLRGGADFAALAMDYSEDPQTVAQGGDLGYVPMSALRQSSPALRDVVLKTQPGNVTTAMAGGAHMLVMVVSREDPGQRDLSAPNVRDGIREMLTSRRSQLLRDAYITAARDEADIVNHLARQVVSAQGAVPPGIGLTAPAAK